MNLMNNSETFEQNVNNFDKKSDRLDKLLQTTDARSQSFFVKFDHAGIFDLEIFCIELRVLSQTSYRLKFKHFEDCLDCSW